MILRYSPLVGSKYCCVSVSVETPNVYTQFAMLANVWFRQGCAPSLNMNRTDLPDDEVIARACRALMANRELLL